MARWLPLSLVQSALLRVYPFELDAGVLEDVVRDMGRGEEIFIDDRLEGADAVLALRNRLRNQPVFRTQAKELVSGGRERQTAPMGIPALAALAAVATNYTLAASAAVLLGLPISSVLMPSESLRGLQPATLLHVVPPRFTCAAQHVRCSTCVLLNLCC